MTAVNTLVRITTSNGGQVEGRFQGYDALGSSMVLEVASSTTGRLSLWPIETYRVTKIKNLVGAH